MKTILLLTTALVLLCAYAPEQNINIRFGKPGTKGTVITRSGYVLAHHSFKKNCIWASYYLSKELLTAKISARGEFMADPKLIKGERAEQTDYEGSSYVKAQMASPSDMARDAKTMAEAYYLSNVCPMNKSLYDIHWSALCRRTRDFIKAGTGCWIIAGPIYGEKSKKIGPGKVYVPEQFYRIALFQAKDYSFRAIAFLLPNREVDVTLKKCVVSIDTIEQMTGLNFFNVLPEEVQSALESKPASGEWVEQFLES